MSDRAGTEIAAHQQRANATSMVVSVIIPVYNGAAVIAGCLDAIFAQTLPATAFEVIVVNNGSTDATVATVQRYPVRLAHEPRVRSSYAARNAGVRIARGTILAFTDADCRPSPRWLAAALDALAQGADLVGGRIEQELRNPHNPWEQYDRLFYLNQRSYVRAGWAVTANLIARRELFERIGPFHVGEAWEDGYDQEWGLRAVGRGACLRYSHDAVVHHLTRKCFSGVATRLQRVNTGSSYHAYQTYHKLRRSKKWLYLLANVWGRLVMMGWRAGHFVKTILQGRLPVRAAAVLGLAWPVLEWMRFAAFCRAWKQNSILQSRRVDHATSLRMDSQPNDNASAANCCASDVGTFRVSSLEEFRPPAHGS